MSKSKVPYEKKVEIVRDYLEGRKGYTESVKRANNSMESFRRRVYLYKEKGAAGLLPNSKNKVYPEDVKRKAIQEYLSGHGSLESICEKYEIRSTRQLRKWIKEYNAHGDFNSRKNSGGGSYMNQGRDTTQEERIQIVKDCLASGKNYGEMCTCYNLLTIKLVQAADMPCIEYLAHFRQPLKVVCDEWIKLDRKQEEAFDSMLQALMESGSAESRSDFDPDWVVKHCSQAMH